MKIAVFFAVKLAKCRAPEVEAGEQRWRDIDLVEEEVERRRRRHGGEQRRRGPYYGAMRPDEFQRQKSPLTWETPNARLEAEQDMRDSPRPVVRRARAL